VPAKSSLSDRQHTMWDVAPTRDLKEMLSSDEDEDDDGMYKPLPTAPVQHRCDEESDRERASSVRLSMNAVFQLQPHVKPMLAPAPSLNTTLSEPGSDDPQEEPSRLIHEDDHRNEGANAWDSESEGSDENLPKALVKANHNICCPNSKEPVLPAPTNPKPATELKPLQVHVGHGIVADSNFVQEDWDD